jgi:hypothetical protein
MIEISHAAHRSPFRLVRPNHMGIIPSSPVARPDISANCRA